MEILKEFAPDLQTLETDTAVTELSDSQLAFVGGGAGDVVFH